MNKLSDAVLGLAIFSTLLGIFGKELGAILILAILMFLVLKPVGGIQMKSFSSLMEDMKQSWKLHQQSIRMSRRKREWFKKHGYK